jgi:hypothetical protein
MKRKSYLLLVVIYIITIVYEYYLNVFVSSDDRSRLGAITQVPLALIPITGSFIGISIAKKWGGFKSRLGKSLYFFSFGCLAWGLGVVGWLFYIYALGRTEVPYPSPADFVYMIAQVTWYIACINMARVVGAQFGLKKKFGWSKVVLGTAFSVTASYLLLLTVARGGVLEAEGFGLRTFFDFYYPIATMLSLTLITVIFLLSRRFLGGMYKKALIVLFAGFIFQYMGDFLYTLSTGDDSYYNGHWSDMLFTTAMMIITTGLVMFDTNTPSLKPNAQEVK